MQECVSVTSCLWFTVIHITTSQLLTPRSSKSSTLLEKSQVCLFPCVHLSDNACISCTVASLQHMTIICSLARFSEHSVMAWRDGRFVSVLQSSNDTRPKYLQVRDGLRVLHHTCVLDLCGYILALYFYMENYLEATLTAKMDHNSKHFFKW